MADTITRDDNGSQSNVKTFALSTTNTLFSSDPHAFGYIHLDGSKYGRPFVPNRVTISYNNYVKVKVFLNASTPTRSGSTTYYDPNTVVTKTNTQLFPKTYLQLSAMPSWLSALVLPNI